MTSENNCPFCLQIKDPNNKEFFFKDDAGLFVAKWDFMPERPGHALVIPTRHAQFLHELNQAELGAIASAAEKVEEIILKTNLTDMYNGVFALVSDSQSREAIDKAKLELITVGNRPPDAFNDWINDGPVAGQSVHHLHWHVVPRWAGDVPNPEGGARHMFDSQGKQENT